MDNLISRQAAIEYFKRIIDATNTDGRYNLGFIDGLEFCINHLSTMPSTQLEQPTEKWIPIKSRPMDEDERKEWEDIRGYKLDDDEAVIYTSLPDDGQNVLICFRNGEITMDTFENTDRGCYFVEYGEMDGVVAWMPLPEPWRNEQ